MSEGYRMEFDYLVHARTDAMHRTVRGRGSVEWDPANPLFLKLAMVTDGDPEVQWSVSRDLFAEGIYSYVPVGYSDVRVRRGGSWFTFELSADGQVSSVTTLRAPFVDFLCKTLDRMPSGEAAESEIILGALDAFIEQVYREGAAE